MEEKESCRISDLLNQIRSIYIWVELPHSLKKIKFLAFYLCYAVKLPDTFNQKALQKQT